MWLLKTIDYGIQNAQTTVTEIDFSKALFEYRGYFRLDHSLCAIVCEGFGKEARSW
jgi:hypothetical protein